MFTLLWAILPGPTWIKITVSVIVGLGLAALVWFLLYPWAYNTFIFDTVPTLE